MKTCKCVLLLFAFSMAIGNVRAQKTFPNNFKLTSAAFYIKDRHITPSPVRQVGFAYERRLLANFHSGISYQQWQGWGGLGAYRIAENVSPELYIGKLMYRRAYKMIDIGGIYKYNIAKTKHMVSVGLYGSYTWGINTYIASYSLNLPWTVEVYGESAKADYFGIVPRLMYDYHLFNRRLNVGIDLAARRYFDLNTPSQYDYGIHAGVNF